MNCKKCGNVLLPTDAFCKVCGEPVALNNVPNQSVDNTLPNQTVNTGVPVEATPAQIVPESPVSAPQSFVTPSAPVSPVNVPPVPPISPEPVAPVTSDPLMNQSQPVMPQPVVQPQQPMPASGTDTPTEEKKKSPLFTIIVVVLLVIILLLGAFLVYNKFFAQPVDNGANTVNQNSGTEVAAAQTFTYKGFTYTLPTGYTFNTSVVKDSNGEDTVLGYIVNNQGSFISGFNVYLDSVANVYSKINIQLDAWKASYASMGYTLQNVELKNVNGSNWVLLTLLDPNQTICYDTYASFGSSYLISGNIEVLGSSTLESTLNMLDNMYKTATYNGSTSFATSGESPVDDDINGDVESDKMIAFASSSVNEQ